MKNVDKEKDAFVELGKVAGLEKDVAKALTSTEEKDVSVPEAEVSIASIPVQERKEENTSMLRKQKKELEDLHAGVEYHKIHQTKKAQSEDEGETILP